MLIDEDLLLSTEDRECAEMPGTILSSVHNTACIGGRLGQGTLKLSYAVEFTAVFNLRSERVL